MDELEAASGDSSRIAHARVSFLTHDEFPVTDVRRPVLASWVRSRRWNLPADRIDLPYVTDPDLDPPLARSATPVLRRLHEHLDGQPISVILTERNGLVLRRLTADAQLSRHLDRVHLAPGFSYSEQFAGTNGIGTALERGGPMHVFGHEHYAEDLEDLACAGVPIKHPISGKIVGAIDLTCWRKDAGSLLITLAKTTADQIRAALLTDASAREQELLHEYLLAGRRSGDMVLAVNEDLLLMNASAQQNLDGSDQAAVLAHAADLLAQAGTNPQAVELPSGRRVRITSRPVPEGGRGAAAVIQVTEQTPGSLTSVSANRPPPRPELPGLVGRSAPWLATSREVDNAYRAGHWIVLSGEPGAGKVALARAAHQQNNPAGSCRLVDAAKAMDHFADDLEAELADDTVQALVIRHAERLDPRRLDELIGALYGGLERRLSDPPWVVVTLTTGGQKEPDLSELLTLFPLTVDVPPLRHHIDDVRELVPFFLSQLSHGDLTCSPEAMHQLLRSAWPGNTAELHQVLKQVVQHRRRAGVIMLADLPADLQAISRRSLSQLEALERDAIIQSLVDNNGDKRAAARSLGMSRATIYRKIHDFGIQSPGR
ncbi:transcriptional regulator of acetoin/glycerol metabolism [Kribbella sp. VKM Ac-2527]|uniref:Transcriptional regulator of acetoin/glycerol metabolism n=1 Tax=Kribbella caucasensis TaxID=2512215 RepID=A0A4R6KEW7_9ACTN|nr:GAF domain-containing protein [Kribbella sp. VKM Ac-2527]TDO46626.1 transcriptional regulator of acetoin/glycerol metabolism [Kribbella sp. VKM Ac-2527]